MRSASVGDVADALRGAGVTLLSAPEGRGLAVRRPVLHDPRQPLTEATAGILIAPTLVPDDDMGRTLVSEAARSGYAAVALKAYDADTAALVSLADRVGVALLGVPDDLDWLQLVSLVSAILDFATRSGADEPMVGDLFALANAVAASVGGATTIEDFQQRILAYSTVSGQPTDEERREGILGRQVPEVPENPEQYRALYRTRGVLRFGAEPPALPRVAVAVRAGTELLGSIWVVDGEGGLAPDADRSLLAAADVAALHLLRARSAEDLARRHRVELVGRLLEGRADPIRTIDQLGLDGSGPFAVLGFDTAAMPDATVALHRVVDLVALHVETRMGRAASALVDGTVYALVSGPRTRSERLLLQMCEDLVAAARQSLGIPLLAAVGPPAAHPGEIDVSRAGADRTLHLLRGDPERGPVTSAALASDQLSLLGLGGLLIDHAHLRSSRAEAVWKHDDRHGTTYQQLLVTYLDCHRDVNRVARILSAHPNTVRYRLRRAVELFGLDFDDPDQMLVAWLSLRVGRSRQMEKRYDPSPQSPASRQATTKMPDAVRKPAPRE